MTRKYKNFWYTLTPREFVNDVSMAEREVTNDVLLHIAAGPGSPHMYSNAYPDVTQAIDAAEVWIESAHKTVLDYYRGASTGNGR